MQEKKLNVNLFLDFIQDFISALFYIAHIASASFTRRAEKAKKVSRRWKLWLNKRRKNILPQD